MSLVISDELIRASGMSEAELFQELVLMLFAREKLSLGKASRLLGVTQLDFQALLAEHDLYVHYDVEDLWEDLANLKAGGLL
jgi:predicted HTH domain antitoxin